MRTSDPTDIRLQLLDAGWRPIPAQGKAAALTEWTRYCTEAPSESEVVFWSKALPHAQGTGLACGRTIVAIMENFQRADGGVDVPPALRAHGAPDEIRPLATS